METTQCCQLGPCGSQEFHCQRVGHGCCSHVHVVSLPGVVSMFGSTYNGQFEDVKAFNDKVGKTTAAP